MCSGDISNFSTWWCGEIWYFSTFIMCVMWRNFRFLQICHYSLTFLHRAEVNKSEISSHLSSVWCGEISVFSPSVFCVILCTQYLLCTVCNFILFVISFITKNNNVYSLWSFVAFYATSFCKNIFFCKLRCFVAKSVLSRFTRFCVEKNWA